MTAHTQSVVWKSKQGSKNKKQQHTYNDILRKREQLWTTVT